MRRLSIIGLASVLFIACGPGRQAAWEEEGNTELADKSDTTSSADDLATLATESWAGRLDRAQLEAALGAWEKQLSHTADDPALLTSLARGYYLLADTHMRLAGEEETMLATFEKGVLAGEKAMMAASAEFAAKVKEGAKVEEVVTAIPATGQSAIYWYATNLGKFAVTKGFTTTLFYKDRIFAVMQRVLDIDETFFHGAPHRYFGAFYAKAPSFAGGDMEKSKEHFDRALELEPLYLGTKVLYAEFYAAKADDRELFEKLLNEVKAGNPDALPDLLPEMTMEQQKADRLLAQADDIF